MDTGDDWQMTSRLQVEQGKGDPFAAAMRATRMPMVITDPRQPDNPIVFANDAFLRLTGYQRDDVIGRNCRFLQGAETDRDTAKAVRDALEGQRGIAVDILNYRRDGSDFWNALYISPVTNEAGELRYYFASQVDITDRKRGEMDASVQRDAFEREVERRTAELRKMTDDLRAALAAKETLLHEVDHRVKNNLQMISSMILMQTRAITDEKVRNSLRSMLERVEALATVHRRLYQADDVSTFDVAEFARDLVHDLVGASGRSEISVNLQLEPVLVAAPKAAPLALILNELVTNVLKHAFPGGRSGRLGVSLTRNGESLVIRVDDDGVGNKAANPPRKTFGNSLINTLSRQLQGTVTQPPTPAGTCTEVTVPIGSSG